MNYKIPVNLSNRHVHLLQKDVEKLFGEGYRVKKKNPDDKYEEEFLAAEVVTLEGPKGKIEGVRVFGGSKVRYTQVELLRSDCYKLGIDAPIAMSGDLKNSAEIKIIGPCGEISAKCAIIAARHLHMEVEIARSLNLKDGDVVSLKIEGPRALTFHLVRVRAYPGWPNIVHLDFDEGNAAGLVNGDMAEIVIIAPEN